MNDICVSDSKIDNDTTSKVIYIERDDDVVHTKIFPSISSLVCIEKYLFYVGIVPICDTYLICIFRPFFLYVILKTDLSNTISILDTHIF